MTLLFHQILPGGPCRGISITPSRQHLRGGINSFPGELKRYTSRQAESRGIVLFFTGVLPQECRLLQDECGGDEENQYPGYRGVDR